MCSLQQKYKERKTTTILYYYMCLHESISKGRKRKRNPASPCFLSSKHQCSTKAINTLCDMRLTKPTHVNNLNFCSPRVSLKPHNSKIMSQCLKDFNPLKLLKNAVGNKKIAPNTSRLHRASIVAPYSSSSMIPCVKTACTFIHVTDNHHFSPSP